MRQGEDNVEVWHRQQFGGARGKPLGARVFQNPSSRRVEEGGSFEAPRLKPESLLL
jgi:hypothetical protein